MINAEPGPSSKTAVLVRPGFQHPTLGAIGGWKGVILRSFEAGGVTYCDVEISPETTAALSGAERGRFYNSRIVFTRFRLAAGDTQPLAARVPGTQGQDTAARIQHEWYDEVGAHQQDPTQFVADRSSTGPADKGRREVIRSLVGVAVFMLSISILIQRDCNNGNRGNGSWGRSGGFSS